MQNQFSEFFPQSASKPSAEHAPASWAALIEQGDGYLTPEQRQAFEQAIEMITCCMQQTLGKPASPAEQAEYFDFSAYVDSMEERFLQQSDSSQPLQQDVSLAAARIIQHIAHHIRQ
ncbi:hypothetical protein [Vibrio quintilis]|uniref:HrpW-specific chaperone n=1 Tax=Vibrio quintilis TaxID=1117707 RepID=A0A1M7YSR6_9VIBR|nr:hypothetical protein [Vibrio quintilis]SHO55658.1 hypothetical protein VQ7734_01404 [Vibrio quintilis]